MPTPASSARQCLSEEAAKILDEAMAVAKRRNHAQTTSLHVVSALLSLPSSGFREACIRSRNGYSNRLQYRALELCFSVALDRLPSSSSSSQIEEPPVSNSLMAAIKRSQANQRRSSVDATHYQTFQQQQQQQSLVSVKVDSQQLILSILDDPLVSRVMGEAGFWSNDVKLAIRRPPSLVRFSRGRCPPLFLCNFTDPGFEMGFRGLPSFGFGPSEEDDNLRRIGEVLVRKKKRNPLLVGTYGSGLIREFLQSVERRGVPEEISGLKFVCIEKQVLEFGAEKGNSEGLGLKFKELDQVVERCSGPGVLVSIGDLKGFVDCSITANYVVSELTRLLKKNGRLWLIGVATYDTYLKFLTCYPSIESDWDLQLLPITSLRPAQGLFPRPSLMESFVPFGGLFATSSDLNSPFNSSYQSISRCHLCNEKYEQEVAAILKECTLSVVDQDESRLPLGLQREKVASMRNGADFQQTKDDGLVLNAKVLGLQRKWDDICQNLHHKNQIPESYPYRRGTQVLPGILGNPYVAERGRDDSCSGKNINGARDPTGCRNVFPMSMNLKENSLTNPTMAMLPHFNAENLNSLSEIQLKLAKHEKNQPENSQSHSSVSSVTTDLALGRTYAPLSEEHNKQAIQTHKERLQDFTGCMPATVNMVEQSTSMTKARLTSSSLDSSALNISFSLRASPSSQVCVAPRNQQYRKSSDLTEQFDRSLFERVCQGLKEKVGRQDEAIYAISETVARCKTGKERLRGASPKGDIWLSFLGLDRVGKKKVALALAEVMFGNRNSFICMDLSIQDGLSSSRSIFDHQEINGYELRFRGKTVLDHIAGEIRKNPLSVVFLENVGKADLTLQNSLSQAIQTGRFSDSYGREIVINRTIFVTTAITTKGEVCLPGKESVSFSEEMILAAQPWQMQILVDHSSENISNSLNVSVTKQGTFGGKCDPLGPMFPNKRKLSDTGYCKERHELETTKRAHKGSGSYLDLNLSIEEMETKDSDSSNDENDNLSENTEIWINKFFDSVDRTVMFSPFDFDGLANNILKDITENFRSIIGPEGVLEIDSRVMEQILAAGWLSEGKRALEDWVKHVLGNCFVQARQKYSLSPRSVLKLVSCENLFMEEQAPGVCLPAKIILC